MRLISLELKNIRSYRQTTIEFPSGITLLSGDIGAGKSTLLLAIEFALFGLSRSELLGNALLRHGATDGKAALRFTIADQHYTICRTLKRSANGVTQDTGWIESGGSRELLTPSELRARMYELLGYPMQFLSKQRNLLYRFTIYTPQEEMKSILSQTSEERIETIRRIFNVDAYRVARDNAHLLAKALKERETLQEQLLPRLEQERNSILQRLEREQSLAEQKRKLHEERSQISHRALQLEQQLTAFEHERSTLAHEQQLRAMQERNIKVAEAELQQLKTLHSRKERQVQETQSVIDKIKGAIIHFTVQTVPDAQAISEAQSQLEVLRQEEGKVLGIIDQCSHAPTLSAGSTCPTCKQQVSVTHITDLRSALDAQLGAAKKKRERINEKILDLRDQIAKMTLAVERNRQAEDLHRQQELQEKLLAQYTEELKLSSVAIVAKQSSIIPLPAVDDTLLIRMRALDQQTLEARSMVQKIRQHAAEVEKHLGRIEQEEKELENMRERLVLLEREKLERQQALERTAQVRHWVARQFSPFTATVERHVLMTIHSAFDAVFRQWFSRLIEDETLSTRIDHEFSPIMLQHGYETDVSYLSGGERTSVSLAYRLALVHTIHLLSPHLGTSGLLMLDEPTDGFSAEQLERVRDVLRELRMEQIILVSHEQQLEGFVDHILRVRKSGDGSVIEIAA